MTEILNNQGYSYICGGTCGARAPDNPTIINNLQLLNSSSRFIQRDE